jgi:hypothetical protein
MTVGIYALYWEEPDLVYVGKSEHLEDRVYAHNRYFKHSEHYNLQMQEVYNKYGPPVVLILEQNIPIQELNRLEILWVNEFDSLNYGLNIQEPGVQTGSGTLNPNSRHSKRRVLRAFSYLYKYGYIIEKVSKLTGIPMGTLSHINCGKAHLWLKEEYPAQFSQMLKNAKNYDKISLATGSEKYLKDPLGNIHRIINLSSFCKSNEITKDTWNNYRASLSGVASGKREQYKGWTLVKN